MPPATGAYTLDDANATVNALNVGDSLLDTITVLTVDGTSQDITLTIQGADDAPVITRVPPRGTVTEDTGVPATGTMMATDPDDPNGFQAECRTGRDLRHGDHQCCRRLERTRWMMPMPTVNALNVGDSLLDTITVLTVDGTSQDITLTIQGADDAPVISGTIPAGTVTEDTGVAGHGHNDGHGSGRSERLPGRMPDWSGPTAAATINAAGDWSVHAGRRQRNGECAERG